MGHPRSAIALATILASGVAVAKATPDACKTSTSGVFAACKASAASDRSLALAKCANLADPAARKSCAEQATADKQDASQSCKEGRDFRLATCRRLGPAPYSPAIDPANFVATIDNPYLPLVPGTTLVYEGQTADGVEHNEVAVTHNTRTILGIPCVEVLDTVTLNGELTERTLDWFAQDKDGNVWYFGENSQELAGGLIVDLGGSFTAGVDGAQPGIIMEAHPAVGDFYRQEFDLGNAEDLAEVLSLDQAVTVPAGSFPHCLQTKETEALEPDALEQKYYAAGIGNVLTVDLVTGERLQLLQIKTM
jgi:hypothetical protein